jgi:hypothetical protein
VANFVPKMNYEQLRFKNFFLGSLTLAIRGRGGRWERRGGEGKETGGDRPISTGPHQVWKEIDAYDRHCHRFLLRRLSVFSKCRRFCLTHFCCVMASNCQSTITNIFAEDVRDIYPTFKPMYYGSMTPREWVLCKETFSYPLPRLASTEMEASEIELGCLLIMGHGYDA